MKEEKHTKNIIFVAGTGRSGTHLIGRTVASHPLIKGRIEDSYTFPLLTRVATTQDFNNDIVNFVLKKVLFYRLKKINVNKDFHILEKSHPSLWLAKEILNRIPNAKFIGVYRDVEPTVNSMLNHDGVLNWYNKLPQNKPNKFLGITEENKVEFNNFSLEKKCALRWASHMKQLQAIKNKYPNNILCVDYDNFIANPSIWLHKLSLFLNVENSFNPEKINLNSKDKWKNKLTQRQLNEISDININKMDFNKLF